MIRGHRHLQECAYIGDDSSEELEELLEIAAEKGIVNLEISSPESPANRVDLLTKHRPEVQFHDERLRQNAESYTFGPHQALAKDSEDNISGKRMKTLLGLLPHKANKFKANVTYNATHSFGKQVDRLKNQLKQEIENREKFNKTGATGKELPSTINIKDFIKLQQADHVHKVRETNVGNHETENVQLSSKDKNNQQSPAKELPVLAGDENSNPNATSSEIVEDVLSRLNRLDAEKRDRILNALNKQRETTEISDKLKTAGETNSKIPATKRPKNGDSSAQDEVEILDLNERKMGTYKRKRSKFAIQPIYYTQYEHMLLLNIYRNEAIRTNINRRIRTNIN